MTSQKSASRNNHRAERCLAAGAAVVAATALPTTAEAKQASASMMRPWIFDHNNQRWSPDLLQGLGQRAAYLFSHAGPLTADDWDGQVLFFGMRGYRVIAHDRRGHGRSTQTWDGNEMDTYAERSRDAHRKTRLKQAIHVGHSNRRRRSRTLHRKAWHGARRQGGAHQRGATADAENGQEPWRPAALGIRRIAGAAGANRPQFYKEFTLPFYGYNRPGAKISEGIREHWCCRE